MIILEEIQRHSFMNFLIFLELVVKLGEKKESSTYIAELVGLAHAALEPLERSNYKWLCLNEPV